MRSLLAGVALAAAVLGTVAATTQALVPLRRPPADARIVLGSGMAGATLNQRTSPVTDGGLKPAPFSSWGKLQGEFCFEGTSCSWVIPGDGDVFIERDGRSRRVLMIGTTAKRWKTSRGVGPGTSIATLRARYSGLTRMTTCQIGGFGAPNTGYRLGQHSFFGTAAGKVTVVYVTRYAIRSGC
ncbi:hypothetical protein DSM112329_00095 [Paraconexibacter sp. AEG42_29]|uniref:Uncharacterized protein n=1 Tax=Paraconexibacter sp. AEG42_29 TaxID=2997339 RepID=A0AAU7ANR1_9ACTN